MFGKDEKLLLLLLIRQGSCFFSGQGHGSEHVSGMPDAEAVLRRVVLGVSLDKVSEEK